MDILMEMSICCLGCPMTIYKTRQSNPKKDEAKKKKVESIITRNVLDSVGSCNS